MSNSKTEFIANFLYEVGIVNVATSYLGFDIRGTLTKEQAEEFHRFILPMITREYARIQENEEETQEFLNLYNTLMPAEILVYLVNREWQTGDIISSAYDKLSATPQKG